MSNEFFNYYLLPVSNYTELKNDSPQNTLTQKHFARINLNLEMQNKYLPETKQKYFLLKMLSNKSKFRKNIQGIAEHRSSKKKILHFLYFFFGPFRSFLKPVVKSS